jgi:hypothetical protein
MNAVDYLELGDLGVDEHIFQAVDHVDAHFYPTATTGAVCFNVFGVQGHFHTIYCADGVGPMRCLCGGMGGLDHIFLGGILL